MNSRMKKVKEIQLDFKDILSNSFELNDIKNFNINKGKKDTS